MRNVADDDLADDDLDLIAAADDGKFVLSLDFNLKIPKLFIFGEVGKCGDENDDNDRDEDGDTLNPAGVMFI